MNRREFVSAGILTGLGALAPGVRAEGRGSGESSGVGRVKFCVFADLHYRPGVFPNSTRSWLERILNHAAESRCDFIIQCGDFCHNPLKELEYVDFYNDFKIPTYHVIGNHDDDQGPHSDTLKAYRLKSDYYHFDRNGFRFIVLDTNYMRWPDGHYTHKDSVQYAPGTYPEGTKIPTWGAMSSEEIDWFRSVVMDSPYPCVLFSHKSFERGVGNRAVKEIIDAANMKEPGKVRFVVNGHHHVDHLRILDGVVYFDVNSASFMWVGGAHAHSKYPAEYVKKQGIGQRNNVLAYEDPLHAIVTLDLDGRIKIEGMKSNFACGVTPKSIRYELDCHHRLITSEVQSADFKMNFS